MVQPLFSIITANFNSGEKLSRTAASITAQCGDWEYIVIDGASSDPSLDSALQLARDDPGRIRLLSEPDRGIYDAMNKGIRAALGRYLYFIGAGDRLLPGVLERVAGSLPSHDRAFLYGDVLWSGTRYDGPFDWRKLCRKNICHQAIFYGRGVFESCGLYDLRYRNCADWDMNLKCFGRSEIEKIYLSLVIAEYEGDGSSSTGDAEFERDKLERIRQHLGLRRALRLGAGRIAGRLLSKAGWGLKEAPRN
jgi:glycosyltransferase involved in cell wall biosynthesis